MTLNIKKIHYKGFTLVPVIFNEGGKLCILSVSNEKNEFTVFSRIINKKIQIKFDGDDLLAEKEVIKRAIGKAIEKINTNSYDRFIYEHIS